MNIEVSYMGMKLRNPLVAASSGMTASAEKIQELEKAGIAAVVLKSLFEEQIIGDAAVLFAEAEHSEAIDYIKQYVQHSTVEAYLSLIKKVKQSVSIPVIASINCVSVGTWVEFARQIEQAGADAIELNLFFLPTDKYKEAAEYENVYYTLVHSIKKIVKIPVAIKIGYHFTNLFSFANKLEMAKADAMVLFNRFWAPDIDIDGLQLTAADIYSEASDIRHTIRWIGLLSGNTGKMQLAASTGAHNTQGVIKQILAGAHVVQLCSALYKKGTAIIPAMLDDLQQWMMKQNFKSIDDFRGKLNYSHVKNPALYERSQFVKYFAAKEY